jgi:hypothetical protein
LEDREPVHTYTHHEHNAYTHQRRCFAAAQRKFLAKAWQCWWVSFPSIGRVSCFVWNAGDRSLLLLYGVLLPLYEASASTISRSICAGFNGSPRRRRKRFDLSSTGPTPADSPHAPLCVCARAYASTRACKCVCTHACTHAGACHVLVCIYVCH